MISIIIPINHKDRVDQLNNLVGLLKAYSGVPVEVIVACDNPEIYSLLDYDVLVRIPKRLEFTQSVNIAEKFATNELVWYMDDSVTPVKNWAKIAIDAFYERFPTGEGLMEISGVKDCATRCIGTRSFLYSLNANNFLWPEYFHCGDSELFERTSHTKQFFPFPQVLLQEKKIDDESRLRNVKIFKFDDMIRGLRRANGFPQSFLPNWKELLLNYCAGDPDLMELYRNFYNLKET